MRLAQIKELALDILFPPICFSCGKHVSKENSSPDKTKLLCEDCYASIKKINTLFCPICMSRIPGMEKICHFNSAYLLAPASDYGNETVRNLIQYLKYRKLESIVNIIEKLSIEYLENLIDNSGLIIKEYTVTPIPLNIFREKERGFNQAKLIAEKLRNHFNLEQIDALYRIKNTKPQAKTKGTAKRQENISGCFKLVNPGIVSGKNLIVVDDVYTSGSTMNEAVRILKEGGAKKIIAFVVAKA